MKLKDCKGGMRVVYARGAKGPLIGKLGTVINVFVEENEIFGIVSVKFDKNGHIYPCWVDSLDLINLE
jgi:hypothetical protein